MWLGPFNPLHVSWWGAPSVIRLPSPIGVTSQTVDMPVRTQTTNMGEYTETVTMGHRTVTLDEET